MVNGSNGYRVVTLVLKILGVIIAVLGLIFVGAGAVHAWGFAPLKSDIAELRQTDKEQTSNLMTILQRITRVETIVERIDRKLD